MTSQYGAYALRAGLARLHARTHMHTPTLPGTHMHALASTHTETNMRYLLLFDDNSGHVNATQCYVIRTLPVLLQLAVYICVYVCVYIYIHTLTTSCK